MASRLRSGMPAAMLSASSLERHTNPNCRRQTSRVLVLHAAAGGRIKRPASLHLESALRCAQGSARGLLRTHSPVHRVHSGRSRHSSRNTPPAAGRPAGCSRHVYRRAHRRQDTQFSSRSRFSLDPRVHATQADLEAQLALARRILSGIKISYDEYQDQAVAGFCTGGGQEGQDHRHCGA
jgi:hypothetical protein